MQLNIPLLKGRMTGLFVILMNFVLLILKIMSRTRIDDLVKCKVP